MFSEGQKVIVRRPSKTQKGFVEDEFTVVNIEGDLVRCRPAWELLGGSVPPVTGFPVGWVRASASEAPEPSESVSAGQIREVYEREHQSVILTYIALQGKYTFAEVANALGRDTLLEEDEDE